MFPLRGEQKLSACGSAEEGKGKASTTQVKNKGIAKFLSNALSLYAP